MDTPPPLTPAARPRTAGLAIACLVLGICSILCLSILAGIPALILGSLALKRIGASDGSLGGRTQALAGIIMGVVSFALLPLVCIVIAIAFAVARPAVAGGHAKAQEAACLHNVQQCTLACAKYALEHDATLPRTWGDVEKYAVKETPAQSLLHCPQARDRAVSYEIVNPGRRLAELGPPAEALIVREIQANHHGRRAVGFADGHADMHAGAL